MDIDSEKGNIPIPIYEGKRDRAAIRYPFLFVDLYRKIHKLIAIVTTNIPAPIIISMNYSY